MSIAISAPVSAEPSQPQDRADHSLPPKSYAEAAAEGLEADKNEEPHDANGAIYPGDVDGFAEAKASGWNIDEARVLYENHVSKQGEKLTSIKPNDSFEKALNHDALSAPRQKGKLGKKQDADDAKLASGRRAGAGWERSA